MGTLHDLELSSVPFFFHLNFHNFNFFNRFQGVIVLDLNKEKALLMIELDEFYNRLEIAEKYDNLGDREWFLEMIQFTKAKLDRLDEAS